jgi:hypothetical protein
MDMLEGEELSEWNTLYESVVLQIRKLDEDGCPVVRALGESDPEAYPRYMLASLSRSYVMARWMMLDGVKQSGDIDKLRIYDRFIADPELNHRLIDPTIMTLRRAGHENAAEVIHRKHLVRYDQIRHLLEHLFRGSLDWSETNIEMLHVVFVTGSDENRKQISANPQASLDMIRERGISRVEELFHVMNSAGGGSVVLSAGAL